MLHKQANDTNEQTQPRFVALRIAGFAAILLLLLSCANTLFQPAWYEWNNYHTHRGFYQQPNDTVEAIFLGASMTVNGFIPTQMYEEQGVCAYNLGTEIQPPMMSYYWTKEAKRLHPNALKVVMFDASQLRKPSSPTISFYHKAFDNMQLSPVKLEAAQDLAQDPDEFFSYLVPSFAYHDRWSSLNYSDFIKNEPTNSAFYRGYNTTYSQYLEGTDPAAVATPLATVTDNQKQAQLNADALVYFERLVTYCREQNLRLVVFATPTSGWSWSDGEHNAIDNLTSRYGITFLDFEVNPLLDEIAFNPNFDTTDSYHLSYSGAAKLSSWIARYLHNECQLADVRSDPKYSFMEQEVKDWHAKFDPLHGALEETDPAEYVKGLMASGNYTLLITAKDDATKSLTATQRKTFWGLGLTDLATLGYHDAYVGMVTNGTVAYEAVKKDTSTAPPSPLTSQTSPPYLAYDDISFDKDMGSQPLTYETLLTDGRRCTLKSGGPNMGNTSSCTIDDNENSPDSRGLNIVVYDNDTHRVVNTANFDTFAEAERTLADRSNPEELIAKGNSYETLQPAQKSLYRYNMRALHDTRARQVASGSHIPYIAQFLKDYMGNAQLRVLLCAKDEAAQLLSTEDCKALADMGLVQLANLNYRESYCAVINADGTIQEASASDSDVASIQAQDFELESAGWAAGNRAIIRIAAGGYGTNHATNARGLHALVYDPVSGEIVEQVNFTQEVRTRDEVAAATAAAQSTTATTATGADATGATGANVTDVADAGAVTGDAAATTPAQEATPLEDATQQNDLEAE